MIVIAFSGLPGTAVRGARSAEDELMSVETQPVETASTMSVSDAAPFVGVSAPTLRRMFDRDLPQSGQFVEGGPTGTGERRVSRAWASAQRDLVAEARARGKVYTQRRPAGDTR